MIVISENLAALENDSNAFGGLGSSGVGGALTTAGPYSTHVFTFDHVYDQNCDQAKVYATTAKSVVDSSLQGYNATIFAYGQTGTGKTYTMEGFNSAEERGIIPRAIEQIFLHIQASVSPRMRYLVRASYLQIYNEVISDLLKPQRSNLVIREDKKKGVYVEGLSEWVVRSPAEIYGLMERGGATRATASTKMNEISSRSHAVFIVIVEQSETVYLDDSGREITVEDFHRLLQARGQEPAQHQQGQQGMARGLEANVRQSFKVGKLNLVDLAGSERVRLTGATGQRLEESKKINQSLSALGNVIASLTEGRPHIPYRDSKLTRILEDSLGGNCKTTMMAMISPALEAFAESLSTLKFANRAKNIKNEARINEDLDQKSLLRRYERELKQLRAQLEERSRSVVDQRRLLELDEQRRRAEEDKMAAIRALEARSREFMREKQEKKRLEERIQLLQGQIMMGGPNGNFQDTPAFRTAVKEHQDRIKAEYEVRLAEMERERESIEEEKAQVDRYKQLLLKQRDIMILLTQRLNERDEQIVALQDELDAYDRHQRELEERLDEKTAALIHLQRVTMEHNAASPVKNSELAEALGDWARPERGEDGVNGPLIAARALSFGNADEIALRRYKPYAEDATGDAGSLSAAGGALGSGAGASAGGEGTDGSPAVSTNPSPSPQPMLSAEEKIGELTRVADAFRAERDRLGRELEDVRAEKVSMEYLLREKLEKLVQSEIETRLQAYRKEGGEGYMGLPGSATPAAAEGATKQLQAELLGVRADLQRAEEEAKTLRTRLTQAQVEKDRAWQQAAGAGAAADLRALQERLALHDKERRAIHTIMEQKIKTLVDAIAGVAGSVAQSVPPTPAGAGAAPLAPQARLVREVQALQRLVNASIAALKNSELEQGGAVPPTPGGSVAAAPLSASGLGVRIPQSPAAGPVSAGSALTPGAGFALGASAGPRAPGTPGIGSAGSAFSATAGASASSISARSVGTTATPTVTGSSLSVDQLIQQRKEELQRQRAAAATGR
jgi:kinesin family protein 3/17